LCGAEKSSGSTVQRTPLSTQRNKHLQTTLIEAAKMAPRNSPELAMLYDKEKQKGNANRSTPAALVQSAREFSDNAGGHGRS
jgi:transposase